MTICRVAGVVAEYNPLHRGHAYHIEETRARTGAEALVAVLSSDFLQRGEPACVNKWTRTAMALQSGVDLVLELPALFSCHNAEVFANAGVDILAATGVVTHLAFGMESPDLPLESLVDILLQEPREFKEHLRSLLNQGYSYAEAKSRALEHSLREKGTLSLGGPNDILALGYAKRVREKNYPLKLIPIRRKGGAYHDPRPQAFASATAIRKLLFQGKTNQALELLPPGSASLLARDLEAGRCIKNFDLLWKTFQILLLSRPPEALGSFAEIREGLENRIYRSGLQSDSWENFVENCSTKRYPRTRIQRHAAHILLGLDHWTNRAAQRLGPPYIRVLGFSSRGRKLLRRMRTHAHLPIVSKAAWRDQKNFAYEVMKYEHRCAALWEILVPLSEKGREKNQRVIE
ncbi:MAG TPA: nucleotidyltransferase family protein, partial [Synergistaceae bacterium]|nr:nucleotidyltransferase family protein [Synergistaceae bacterium]